MTKYIATSLLVSLFFMGCSSKNALDGLNKDSFYSTALSYTQKCDIVVNNEVRSMFTAIYLNSIAKSKITQNEKFIVAVYNAQSVKKEVATQLGNEFKLYLNDGESLSLKALSKDDTRVVNSPLFNPWANYFEAEFPSVTPTRVTIKATINTDGTVISNEPPTIYDLRLKLEHLEFGSCLLQFEKKL